MVIGIDASRAFGTHKTGTENYSYHVVTEMLRLPESRSHTFVLFIRPKAVLPSELCGYSNVIIKEIKQKYLWTQLGLARETWRNIVTPYSRKSVNPDEVVTNNRDHGFTDSRYLDVLWVPAHTLPIFRRGFGGIGAKLKTVVTIHGLEYKWLREYQNLLQRWYLPLSTAYASRAADLLLLVSKFSAKQLQEELHTSSDKIKVVYEGVDASAPRHSETVSLQKYGLQNKRYVLFVGTIQPRKNLPALIEAFARLDSKFKAYKLVMAGGNGWMAQETFATVAKLSLEDRVVFTGKVTPAELSALYLAAKLYVQPSLTEGFGLPILEAMAYGVPVISSDGGALPEVVGEAGVIVSLQSQFEHRLSKAMERGLSNHKLRQKLVSKGRMRVKQLSWQNSARETLKAILNT